MLSARTRSHLKNAKSGKRRASVKIKRHGKSVKKPAKNAHQVQLNKFQQKLLQLKRVEGPKTLHYSIF